MKTASLLAFSLLLAACDDERALTFGLDLSAHDGSQPSEQTSGMCLPPGTTDGGTSGSSIDRWELDEPPPHLFMEAEPDGDRNLYRLRVFTALERDADGFWWQPSAILAERVYERAFGESGAVDSFVVDFEGEDYTVQARGLPPDASCP